MPVIVVLSTYSYVSSIGASVELDTKLKELHDCPGTPEIQIFGSSKVAISKKCDHDVKSLEFAKLSARYLITAITLFSLAIYLAFVAGR